VPKGLAQRFSFGEVKWVDRDTAEVEGGFSNGMDGRANRYRLARKNGRWIVEKVERVAVS
jgi:hypothetical protein